jgi:hypothetical protein
VHLKERFLDASAEEVKLITDIVSVAQLIMMLPSGDLLDPEGTSGSRADDTKGCYHQMDNFRWPDAQPPPQL